MHKPRFLIGIDPGKNTGVGVWDRWNKCFADIFTIGIVEAFDLIDTVYRDCEVWFEDARLIGGHCSDLGGRAQGVGSIKRDSSIWQEFCERRMIKHLPISPKGTKKLSAPQFQALTKWTGRTSQHARDAAMLVIGG